MLTARFSFDDKATKKLVAEQTKNVRKGVLKANDAVVRAHVNVAAKRIRSDRKREPWFKRRNAVLIKQLRRTAQRYRSRFSGNYVLAHFGFTHQTGHAVEHGGRYEQFIPQYTRKPPTRSIAPGRKRRGKGTDVKVRPHKRTKFQDATYVLQITFDQVGPHVTIPYDRMTKIMLDEGRVPKVNELTVGMPGGR